MSQHRVIIEAGPGTIRRLCCGAGTVADGELAEIIGAALGAIDDQVALVGERPLAVAALWSTALRTVHCGTPDARKPMVLVHPSWWSSSRVGVVSAAAATVADDVLARPRSWLITHASDPQAQAPVTVEVAERLVMVSGATVVAIPRGTDDDVVADKVADSIAGTATVVLIDAPSTVAGGPALATLIADAVRKTGQPVVRIDDVRLARLARSALATKETEDGLRREPPLTTRAGRSRARTPSAIVVAIVFSAAAPAVLTMSRHSAVPPKPVETAATTFLVEGRVALTVPANWPTQRVLGGPGSARVQVTSPSDPEVALHVTQSPVAGETLSGTADRLKRAMDAEPDGMFVDFNPLGSCAGRPAVTYREVRSSHEVHWTVLLDGPVQISLGCQSRPGAEDAIRAVCEQAVRSAHAIG